MAAVFHLHASGGRAGDPANGSLMQKFQSYDDKIIYIIRHGEKIDDPNAIRPEAVQCLSEKGWGRSYNMKSVFGKNSQYCGKPDCGVACATLPNLRTPDALFSANYADGPIDCKDEKGRYRTEQTIAALASSGPTSLNLPINNKTGFMPQLCHAGINATFKALVGGHGDKFAKMLIELGVANEALDKMQAWFDNIPTVDADGQPSTCIPYAGNGLGTPLSGNCCNKAAAETIKAKLMEPQVQTILVAWEHINIQWLAYSLGAPKDKVVDAFCPGGSCWPHDNYDIIYALHYSKEGQFLHIDTDLTQGFEWIGPPPGTCGIIGKA